MHTVNPSAWEAEPGPSVSVRSKLGLLASFGLARVILRPCHTETHAHTLVFFTDRRDKAI